MMLTTHSRVTSVSVILVLLLMIGCSNSNNNQQADTAIRTAEVPTVQLDSLFTITSSEEIIFDRISEVLADSAGHIYAVDENKNTIYKFDKTGSYQGSIGRSGSGPGEFRSILTAKITPNSRLLVHDIRQARITIYARQESGWQLDETINFPLMNFGIEAIDSQGNMILRASLNRPPEPPVHQYMHELAIGHIDSGITKRNVLEIKDLKYVLNRERVMNGIPYSRKTILADGPAGNLYKVFNDSATVKIYSTRLEKINSISINIPNLPVTTEEREKYLDRTNKTLLSDLREQMPETKPVIQDMIIDDEKNIWLQTYDSPQYLVLDSAGQPIGSFDLPEDAELADVRDNRIYVLKNGEMGYEIQVFEFTFA